jgi:hypothetical protein
MTLESVHLREILDVEGEPAEDSPGVLEVRGGDQVAMVVANRLEVHRGDEPRSAGQSKFRMQ